MDEPSTPRDQMIQPLRTPPRRRRNLNEVNNMTSRNPGNTTRLFPRFINGDDYNDTDKIIINRIYDHVNSLSTPSREVLVGVNITMSYDGQINFNVGSVDGSLERNKRF